MMSEEERIILLSQKLVIDIKLTNTDEELSDGETLDWIYDLIIKYETEVAK